MCRPASLKLLLLLFVPSFSLYAQEPVVRIGVHSFFDNPELGMAGLRPSRTEAGIRLSGAAGFRWDTTSAVFVGLSGTHEYGSQTGFVALEPIAYYGVRRERFRYFVGAFPRQETIGHYPRMFFRDSVTNYRTVLNGAFYELRWNGSFVNAWLDWTGRQSVEDRETFFVGWSAGWNYRLFHARLFGYLFHYASSANYAVHDPLHDNALQLLSAGFDLSSLVPWDELDIDLGYTLGMERNRDIGRWHTPQGVLAELRLSHCGFGLFNSFYCGDPQQVFPENGSQLYWGDPLYRQSLYNRTDFSYTFARLRHVSIAVTYSLHASRRSLGHEQMLHLYVNLDNCLNLIRKNR
jgi:hypothetical protein